MAKFMGAALTGAVLMGTAWAAVAAATHVRVRGDIASVHGNTVDITSYSGKTIDLLLGPHTRYVSVVPASLSDIKKGAFVGIGATGSQNALSAMEVVIFPASMRGTGEGHYGWSVPAKVADADLHRGAASATAGAPPVQGTMTNGTVAKAGPVTEAPAVQGTMTNGTVADQSRASGGKELTVTYKGGKVNIVVPADVPVVRLQPAGRSIVTTGAKAFSVSIRSGSGAPLHAVVVAVGKNGLMPPM